MIVAQDEPTAGARQLGCGAARSREFRSSRSIEACLMAEVAEPLIYWSVGIACSTSAPLRQREVFK